MKYLGHIVNCDGLQTDPDKVKSILEIAPPSNITELRRFLCMTSWYRRFIRDYAIIAEPLNQLLRKDVKWRWTAAQTDAFEQLKAALSSAPILGCPDFGKPFIIQTDASDTGIAGILLQKDQDREIVIAYVSRALSNTERNYGVTEKECLAVYWVIHKFRQYVEGYRFTVVTDHAALKWLHNLRNISGRLARWALELQQYDFDVIHRKGAYLKVADTLSRLPHDQREINEAQYELGAVTHDAWYNRVKTGVQEHPEKYPKFQITEDGQLWHREKSLFPTGNKPQWRKCLTEEQRQSALHACHSNLHSGHLGIKKTYCRLKQDYYWPGMLNDVVKYVVNCENCQQHKVPQVPIAVTFLARYTGKPWDTVSMDIVGPLPRSKGGFRYLLVFVDKFTKWTKCVPLRAAIGTKIAENFKNLIICR